MVYLTSRESFLLGRWRFCANFPILIYAPFLNHENHQYGSCWAYKTPYFCFFSLVRSIPRLSTSGPTPLRLYFTSIVNFPTVDPPLTTGIAVIHSWSSCEYKASRSLRLFTSFSTSLPTSGSHLYLYSIFTVVYGFQKVTNLTSSMPSTTSSRYVFVSSLKTLRPYSLFSLSLPSPRSWLTPLGMFNCHRCCVAK